MTMQRSPNLVLEPGKTASSFDDLVAGIKDGVVLIGVGQPEIHTDFQGSNGTIRGTLREIKNGVLGASLVGGEVVFNTLNLWKNVTAVGGTQSAEWFAMLQEKGEPIQATEHSVCGVPLAFKNVAILAR